MASLQEQNGGLPRRVTDHGAFDALHAANANDRAPGRPAPRPGVGRSALQWLVVGILALIAVAYFAMPARSAESCSAAWTAEMIEDEGGEVLAASVCARDYETAYLQLSCFGGSIFLRVDLAAGAERAPEPGEERDVVFSAGGATETLHLLYEDMDGMFAGETETDGPLAALLDGAGDVTVADAGGVYPQRGYSLKGSSAAIGKIVADCD